MNINLANIDFCPGGGKSATLTETTAEILLNETEKVIVPPEGTDGFNKVTITHAPVEESVSATITENGTHTITPSEGFGAMFGVSVDVNIPSVTDDKIQYFDRKPTADDAGLKVIGWTADAVNYYKYNNYAYPWEADNYKVSDANKQIVINSKSDIATYKENPDFKYCPMFDTSNVTNMDSMFMNCTSLTSIPLFDTSNARSMDTMFNSCPSLTTIPLLDTHNVGGMSMMFFKCTSLTTIPQLDTSNVTNMGNMFSGCSSLTSIPQLDTSKVTTMGNMFSECTSLISIPQLDTSNVTTMSNMFYYCPSLTSVPLFDTSKVTNMSQCFNNCKKLTNIPQLNTSNVTDMSYMLSGSISLTSIPKLDATSLTTARYMFGYSYALLNKFTDFGGLTNLKVDLDLSPCTALTKESLLNVFNEAADVTASPKTLTLGTKNLNKLTDDEKAIATNKGWTLK